MEKNSLEIIKEMTTKIKEAKCKLIKEDSVSESKEKWIPRKMKKGALHKKLGIPEDEDIPMELIQKEIKRLQKESEGDKKLSDEDSKFLKQLILARTFKKMSAKK